MKGYGESEKRLTQTTVPNDTYRKLEKDVLDGPYGEKEERSDMSDPN